MGDSMHPATFVLQEIENLSQKYGYRIAMCSTLGWQSLLVLYDNSVPEH